MSEVWIEVDDLVQAINDPAVVIERRDGLLHMVAVNTAALSAFDRPEEAVLGTGFAAFYRPEELASLERRVRGVLATRRSASHEVVRELPSGRFVFESWLTPLSEERVLGIGRDISVRAAAVARAAELERLTGTGTWSWSLVDDSVRWSPELRRVLGLPARSTPSLAGVVERIHPDDVEEVFRTLEEVIRSGRSAESEYRSRDTDGSERRIFARAGVVRDADERPVRVFGTVQDVTERRRLQRREQQAALASRQLDRALQLNDDVIQSLARAALALQLGRLDDVESAVHDGMETVRAIMGELLRSTTAFGGGLRSGDLRRRSLDEAPQSLPLAGGDPDPAA